LPFERYKNDARYYFFLVAFLFAGGGFVTALGGRDPALASAADAGSLLSQVVLGSIYACSVVVLIKSRLGITLALRAWPIFALPLLAIISCLWSPDPALTFRRAAAYVGTVVFGLALASAFSVATAVRLVIGALALSMVLSVAFVFALPSLGVHQFTDAVQSVHAGAWRGIFAHRNVLAGQWAAISMPLILLYGGHVFKSNWAWIGAILATAACLVGAHSGTGYVLFPTVLAAGLITSLFADKRFGAPAAVVLGIALAAGVFLHQQIMEALLNLLGKESDLTGRTVYWYFLLQLADFDPLIGGSYFAGIVHLDAKIEAITDLSFGSAHNGYLEVWVYLGWLGLALCGATLLWLITSALKASVSATINPALFTNFPLCIVVFVVTQNTVESTLVAPNCLVVVLLSFAAGILAAGHNVPVSVAAARPSFAEDIKFSERAIGDNEAPGAR
jgi:exopolysaccharide production protein ExoQ